MSMLSYAVADSATMLRRQLRHMLRYLSMTLMLIGMPVVFSCCSSTSSAEPWALAWAAWPAAGRVSRVRPPGIPDGRGRRGHRDVDRGAMDMTEGIIARFRTMAIFRPSVLTATSSAA